MNGPTCSGVSDRLPDWVAGRLLPAEAAEVADHVATCADCADAADVIRVLARGLPPVPAGFEARVSAAVRAGDVPSTPAARVRRPVWSAWVASAAALLIVALGLGKGLRDPEGGDSAGAVLDSGVVEAEVWIGEDGDVAGAPLLDDLSEDALAILLEEMGG